MTSGPSDVGDLSSDEGLLSIGMFSRASLLSIKQLHGYHDAGVLVPARVDARTGYRYYHWSQLGQAAVIRKLRALDLPLAEVSEVVRASDPAVTRAVLAPLLSTRAATTRSARRTECWGPGWRGMPSRHCCRCARSTS